jgi:hypothetical protein
MLNGRAMSKPRTCRIVGIIELIESLLLADCQLLISDFGRRVISPSLKPRR